MESMTLSPEDCAALLRQSARTVAMTGAGISTAAGIPDFRGPEGIYSSGRYDQRVFDIDYFRQDPSEFFRFTRDMLEIVKTLEPTFSHRLLARMEAEGLLEAVITQNIDPLHHLAGSRYVVAAHGDYSTGHCMTCGRRYSYEEMVALLERMEIPRCACAAGGVIKPDVVFFGEMLREMPRAEQLARSCELMLVLGSSLVVYPVALLPQLVSGTVVVVNKGDVAVPSELDVYVVRQDLDEYFGEVAGHLFAD